MYAFFLFLRIFVRVMNQKWLGWFWGILSGASFGLIPLFTLPLLAAGVGDDSILFYRFAVGALAAGLMLAVRRKPLKFRPRYTLRLVVLGLLYMASSWLLLWGYDYTTAGVATTIHFLYPVCVVLLMGLFFGERVSKVTMGAVLLAVVGVAMLSASDGGGELSTVGLVIVVLSAVAYGAYIVALKKVDLGGISGLELTFYVLLVTALTFLVKAYAVGEGLERLPDGTAWVNAVLLGLVPTVVSNFALVRSVAAIGSTPTAILGALEPMTAVAVGVWGFGEPFGVASAVGVVLVVGAVAVVVVQKK